MYIYIACTAVGYTQIRGSEGVLSQEDLKIMTSETGFQDHIHK